MNSTLHHPPHMLINDSWYFITAHTFGSDFPLKKAESKILWIKKLQELAEEFDSRVFAYVILDNHYHLIIFFSDASRIPIFINRLHGATSHWINKHDNCSGRKVWHNYWDRIIRDEDDFYTKFNYIHYNPVKHGYVSDPREWRFSSYNSYVMNKGGEWLEDCWRIYPINDYNFED